MNNKPIVSTFLFRIFLISLLAVMGIAVNISYANGLTPLYALRRSDHGDHLMTVSLNERNNLHNSDWVYLGIEGYIHTSQVVGTIPLRRGWFPGGDHLLTNGNVPSGYIDEGIIGYVYSSSRTFASGLRRYFAPIVNGINNHISTIYEEPRGVHAIGNQNDPNSFGFYGGSIEGFTGHLTRPTRALLGQTVKLFCLLVPVRIFSFLSTSIP